MSKEIWLGPLLGTNRERLLARCAEFVSKGEAHKFLYLAASHPLLELVTERLLDGAKARGVWGEFPVYLFRGFVRRVLAGAVPQQHAPPILPRISIDHEELPLKRSLISQLLNGLAATGKLRALAPLVHRDGCVNSIATLIGEIERSGKTPSEFAAVVEARAKDLDEATGIEITPSAQVSAGALPNGQASELSLFSLLPEAVAPRRTSGARPQIDFDRDIAVVYSAYDDALERFALTDEDADQLRALEILRGELAGQSVRVPWLEQVELLVLDGFFDFTPVQGEMMRCLIPSIPQVLVNLNGDKRNEEIFAPFRATIDQLCSIVPFEVKTDSERLPASGALSLLRERLFNSEASSSNAKEAGACPLPDCESAEKSNVNSLENSSKGSEKDIQKEITLFECSDRETEVRAIAKEIKRLVLAEGYRLADIALVVRERASYADTILRVLSDEGVPCNLERRTESIEVPAVRAALKLFQMLGSDAPSGLKSADVADLVKSDYFRLSQDELASLQREFELEYSGLLLSEFADADSDQKSIRAGRLHRELGIGRWDADSLENVIAFVGSELRVADWLGRARQLIAELPAAEETRELLVGSETADEEDGDSVMEAESERDDPSILRAPRPEKKRRPSREVHPAAIAWASLVVARLDQLIRDLPQKGQPLELRSALIKLLDALQFYSETTRASRGSSDTELAQVALDRRGLESLRRAFAAAGRSIQMAGAIVTPGPAGNRNERVALEVFLNEVNRCLHSQVLRAGLGNRDGLRVLEATDVRGLRFRALFIAGLIEGGFPLRASRDWIYPHEERERLQRYGVTLEDKSPDVLLKEEHYFYQAACRATDRLYLTRPLTLDDGTETVASYYIDELRHAVAPAEIEVKRIRRDFDELGLFDSSSSAELAISLVRQSEQHLHRAGRKNVLPLLQIERLISRAEAGGYLSPSALRRIEIERERAGPSFGPYDGQMTDPDLISLLSEEFGPLFPHSASGLSLYGNCPYKFFASRVLKLQPRGEAALDLEAIDAGKLLHEVLRRFFERHRTHSLLSLDREEIHRELAEVADEVFDEHERVVPPLNPRIWKIDREIRKIIL
ncbi:MAG: PD-(D/E)XK nuclease family protein, partial [Pyrinomonadaceae bacterium]